MPATTIKGPRPGRPPSVDRIRECGVYVIGFDRYVKIGVSADVVGRLAAIQEFLPAKLKVYQFLEGAGIETESALHDRFDDYRLRREWFRLEGDLAWWIADGCP